MKKEIILIVFILWKLTAFADCASSGIYFWHSGKAIKSNGIILIDGYAASQFIIENLNKRFPVYLKSGDQKINFKLVETHKGEFELTQVLLKPEEELIKGLTYELFIEKLPSDFAQIGKWNYETREFEPVEWIVEEGNFSEKPIWFEKPVEKDKTLIYYGCGPEVFVNFEFKTKVSSEFIIKTYVTNKQSKKTTIYYLIPTNNNIIKIGHGMCSGAFVFKKGENFEVSFDLVDAYGNINVWTDKKINFTGPDRESLRDY